MTSSIQAGPALANTAPSKSTVRAETHLDLGQDSQEHADRGRQTRYRYKAQEILALVQRGLYAVKDISSYVLSNRQLFEGLSYPKGATADVGWHAGQPRQKESEAK